MLIIAAGAFSLYLNNMTAIAPSSTPTEVAREIPSAGSGQVLEIPTAPLIAHIPIILKVEEREDYKAGQLYLYKDIYFSDAAGDAYLVTYELVSASIAGIQVQNDPIQSSPFEQEIGTYFTATWDCKNIGTYTIILKARNLDRAGNQSEPIELTFNCH